ncbi:restriction endonuclease subunit S, partial [bacterium]|nr:restriction endonuclease subunit S [bacterium]
MAVQGKLVPQDPDDEPARVLLERIRAEKAKLIKEGKIKKEKAPSYIFRGEDNLPYEKIGDNEPVCIADEVPFEIPESWEWVRLGTVCTKLVDGDHNPPKGQLYKTLYIMASSTNINDDTLVELDKVRYLSKEVFLKENERTNATVGDIFFTSVGSLGRSCIFDGSLNICFQRSVSVISTLLFNQYLKYYLDCGYFQQKIIKEATGTAQKGFYLNQLATSLVPVPPLEEQKRIVAGIRSFLPYIVDYDAKEREINKLNAAFPDLLKKSILQQAVMGKLVPQDENDEPAAVLLERIRAEKEALIKTGKLKKSKHESIIYRRDNSHYEKID